MTTSDSTRALVVESGPGETRAALLKDGTVSELLVLRRTDSPRLGEIYLGRVLRIERGLNAAFVEIGAGPPGFLPLSGPARRVNEGKSILVSVAGEAARGKGPRLSADVAPDHPAAHAAKSLASPACLHRETDLAAAALQAFAGRGLGRIVADGAACFARLRAATRNAFPQYAESVDLHSGPEPAFEAFGIEDRIDCALAPEVTLDSGLRLHVDETAALAAIDLDAASFAPRQGVRATALAANLAAVDAVMQEITVRNLSGLILVDFLRMKDAAERKRVTDAVAKAAAGAPVPLHVHGFTRAGLLELTRERRRRPLSQVLLEPESSRRKSIETVAREALRAARRSPPRGGPVSTLVAAPGVIAWLEGEGRADLAEVESLLHVKLSLRGDSSIPREKFEIAAEAR